MLKIYLLLVGFVIFSPTVFASGHQNARSRGDSCISEQLITHRNLQDSLSLWKHELSVRLSEEVMHCIIHSKDLSPIISQLQAYIKTAHSCQKHFSDDISDDQKQELIKVTRQLELRYSGLVRIMSRQKKSV